MDWIIEFDICAILIISLILWVLQRRKELKTMQNIAFRALLILTLVAAASDLLSIYAIEHAMEIPLWLNYVIQLIYAVPFTSIPMVYYFYVMSLTIQNRIITRSRIIFTIAPYALAFLLIITTPLTHWHFYFNDTLQYSHGWAVYVTYALSFFYIILCFIDISHYKKRLSTMQITTIILICFICAGAVLVQFIVSNLMIVSFAVAFCTLLAYFTLQSPLRTYNATTGTFTLKTFESMLLSLYRKKKKFTVFCMEPQHYGKLYETLGTTTTEALSVAIASTLREMAPDKPLYRLSGLRFALIMEEQSAADLQPSINLFLERYHDPFKLAGTTLTITPVMCTVEAPEAAGYPEDMTNAIQDSLTEAHLLDAEPHIIHSGEASLIKRRRENAIRHVLKRAVQKEEFVIHYQPVYSVRERRFVAAEALLRLKEKSLGDISPSEFIPIAIKTGIMPQISRIVIEQVCAFISSTRLWEKGVRHIGININSPECINELLPDEVTRIMDRYHIPCSMINFEVTEDAIQNNLRRFPEIIRSMASLGTGFTLDAFYSAFSEEGIIFEAPFRQVKLSKAFLDSSMNSEAKRTLLKHTISLFRDLNLEIVAVGIETKEQAEELAVYGCHYYQGFYYSLPLPEQDLLNIFQ